MSAAPLVSVVCSVHNDEAYVERSLRSLMAQDHPELEIVAVDDGSTDRSGSILDALAREDDRIHVIHQANAGLTRALIRGCGEARGVFIARHDLDDVSLPSRLRLQSEALASNPGWSMVACGARFVGPEDELLWETAAETDPASATRLLLEGRKGPPAHGCVMFRREVYERVGGYRRQFYFTQDVDLWMRIGETGLFGYVPEVLYWYRVTERSISRLNRREQLVLGRLALECGRARRERREETDLLEQAERVLPGPRRRGRASSAGAYFIGRCLQSHRDPRARRYLWRAVREKPWHLKAVAALCLAVALPSHRTAG